MKNVALALFCAIPLAATAAPFKLESPDLPAGKQVPEVHIFNGFGCSGKNVSPAVSWKNPPAGTKSFALTVYDPDAPTGSGFWHWVMVNIPADVKELPQGAGDPSAGKAPTGSQQIRTDFGQPGWGGPCPPAGHTPHRYIFTLHALKTEKLELPPEATAALAGFFIHGTSIGKATFTARYGR